MTELQKDENGIDYIELGDGSTIVGELIHDDYSGICFSHGSGAVGAFHPEVEGKMDYQADVFLKIISSNPDSIQVLIDRLRSAKQRIMLLKGMARAF